jgi:TPR repeat protein
MKDVMRAWTMLAVPFILAADTTAEAHPSQVQRCEAAQKGGDAGLLEYCRGIFAASGYGAPRDITAAMRHYQQAAEMGNVDAQAVMGVAYEGGSNVKQDLSLAVKWYEKAAAQGHVGAQLNLGQM